MKFENEFEVRAPADEVYTALLDVERVAPCMPGAEVLEQIDDDAYKVGIKVKLGPVSMTYRGQVEIVDKDPEAHRATMKARAKETRGQGMADATIETSLQEAGELTKGRIETDVQLKGKAAALGQSVIQDVSATLVKTFANNLAEMLAAGGGNGAAPAAEAPVVEPPAAERPAAEPADAEEQPVAEQDAESDALPVGAIAASVVKGRLRDPKVVGVLVLLLLALVLLRRRR